MNMPKFFSNPGRIAHATISRGHDIYVGEDDLERAGYLDEILTARFGSHAESWSLPTREFERMRDNELTHISLLGQLM